MRFHRLLLALLLVEASTGGVSGQSRPEPGPSGAWRHYESPADAGWDDSALARARAFAVSAGADAVLLVHQGKVVVAWGEVTRPFTTYSVRKSLAGLLIGQAVDAGRLHLDASLAALDIDDDPPLTATERTATVRQLLQARSGIYHAAAREPPAMKARRPARGSHAPGAHWFYNNWDFNAVASVYGRATGEDLVSAFGSRLATPLGFEDFKPDLAYWIREPSASRHAAYEFSLSARDLARVGQLVLQRGRWAGGQLVSSAWLHGSTRVHSPLPGGGGYGLLWWVDAHRWFSGPDAALPALSHQHHVAAQGNGGQMLFAVPSLDVVIVTLSDLDHHPGQGEAWAIQLADLLLQARVREARVDAASGPLRAEALPNPPPTPPRRMYSAVSRGREPYVGVYDIAPGIAATVTAQLDGLFIELSGRGQLELFIDGADRFAARTRPVVVTFERTAAGAVTGISILEGTRALRGRRRP